MAGALDWLLLIHQVPPDPAYVRAKVLRRLGHIGALPLKRAAYYLPATDTTMEDLRWLQGEITAGGGEAWVLRAGFISGLTDEDAREGFRTVRGADYAALAVDARAALEALRSPEADAAQGAAELRRLEKRLAAIQRIDFFGAPGREEAETLMQSIDDVLHRAPDAPAGAAGPETLRGRTWLTRRGVKIDRIASAWLIRRFIDPAATFVFTEGGTPIAGAIRFDTYEGEFTHEGDLCTFEVLLQRSPRAGERALAAIAEMVHDLDLKDDRYQRAEGAGLAAMIQGIVARNADDLPRITEGATLFDALYEHFSSAGAA